MQDVREMRGSILSFLDESARELTKCAMESRYRLCPRCFARLTVPRSSSDALGEIIKMFSEESATISLRGSGNNVAVFSDSHGFSLDATTGGTASAFIDSLTISDRTFDRLRTAFEAAWDAPECWIEIASSTKTIGFAASGFCPACLLVPPPLRRRNFEEALRGGRASDAPDLFVEIEGTTAAALLEQSIRGSSAALRSAAPRLTAMLTTLEALGLGELESGSHLEQLSTPTAAAIATVRLLHSSQRDFPLVIDLPVLSSGSSIALGIHRLIEKEAGSRSIVHVCADQPATPAESPYTRPSADCDGKPMAILTIEGRSLELREGSCNVVRTEGLASCFDMAGAIARALRGPGSAKSSFVQSSETLSEADVILVSHANAGFRGRTMIIEELDLYDRAARLFAASHGARMEGLSPSSFKRTGARPGAGICPECRGLGVSLGACLVGDRPAARPCPLCHGARFGPPLSTVRFRGQSFSELLDRTIDAAMPTLKTLPRAHEQLSLVKTLGLTSLPLGLPCALMSSSEARLVRILQAVLSTKTRPRVIILEEPFTGLASGQRDAFRELLDSLPTMCKGAIVLVGTDPRLSSSGELLVSSAHIA
jgi:hypothetical protein